MANFKNNSLCHSAQHTTLHWGKWIFLSAITLMSLSSCINDDMDDCPIPEPTVPAKSKVSLTFDYTYNVKNADAFSEEVKNINVYAFDENGKFFDSYIESKDKFEQGHTMDITDLKDGKYTFVCLARDRQLGTRTDDDEMEFSFASLTPGVSTIDDLTERMGKTDDDGYTENDKDFAALYTAQTTVDYKSLDNNGKSGNVVAGNLSLMKCTKTYRIVLLPYDNEQSDFKPENFDVYIEGSAAWLDHKGDKVRNQPIFYLPYNSEHRKQYSDATTVEGEIIDQALVYDLSSSRMFERDNEWQRPTAKPTSLRNKFKEAANNEESDDTEKEEFTNYNDKRIVIWDLRDKENPRKVFDHSLPWFLALCGERQGKDWSNQEYLDRQDHYILTFYVPDNRDYTLDAKVKVNGWVLNLQNSDLGGNSQ